MSGVRRLIHKICGTESETIHIYLYWTGVIFFSICILFYFPESETWNSYVLNHVKELIIEPLTTLPSKELEDEALKLFKVGKHTITLAASICYSAFYKINLLFFVCFLDCEQSFILLLSHSRPRVSVRGERRSSEERGRKPHLSSFFIYIWISIDGVYYFP